MLGGKTHDAQSIICIISKYHYDNQIKDDDIGRIQHAWKIRNASKILGRKSEGKRPLRRPIDGRIILKHILSNIFRVCTGYSFLSP
jgi:hypothetical protein